MYVMLLLVCSTSTMVFGHEPDEEELDKEFFLAVNRIHE